MDNLDIEYTEHIKKMHGNNRLPDEQMKLINEEENKFHPDDNINRCVEIAQEDIDKEETKEERVPIGKWAASNPYCLSDESKEGDTIPDPYPWEIGVHGETKKDLKQGHIDAVNRKGKFVDDAIAETEEDHKAFTQDLTDACLRLEKEKQSLKEQLEEAQDDAGVWEQELHISERHNRALINKIAKMRESKNKD